MPKFEAISLGSSGSNIPEVAYPSGSNEPGLHLYVDNPRVVELPEEGKITFYFKRGPITVREGVEDRPGSASADLNLTEICDVCACEAPEYSEARETENKIDELFEELRGEKEEPSADENDMLANED
jgi:hypothetical protein